MQASGTRNVWFHREYVRPQGGHIKHAHYFGHAARLPGFGRRITFSGTPDTGSRERERRQLWRTGPGELADAWEPRARDVLFLAGTDWRYLANAGLADLDNPRVNLIQHVRHAHAGTELNGYLVNRAVRVCVSAEVADAINATGRVNGPVFTIPNGTDCVPIAPDDARTNPFDSRPRAITVVGYKRPDLATALSRCLQQEGFGQVRDDGFLERGAFLDMLRNTRVAVCLPRAEEGFYLPALEAMAAGCIVVTLDCIGNRSFCHDGGNCLVAQADAKSLLATTRIAVGMSATARERLHTRARETVLAHSLDAERSRFHEILGDIDHLWADAATTRNPQHSEVADDRVACRPLVDFMIVGVQKGGTTALGHFLSQHREIGMASKEGHVFDSPRYSRDWTPADIDEHYRRLLDHCREATIRGESTPIYLFFPEIPAEFARYNPALKVIVLLRDPVQRAISHYAMERGRGKERWPLWLALLGEPFRLRRCKDPKGDESASRRHAYRTRGLYSGQLRNLVQSVSPDRVLVLRSEDLLDHHDAVLDEVFEFLGVSRDVRIPRQIVFKGEAVKHRAVGWLLRVSYLVESWSLGRILSSRGSGRVGLRVIA